MKNIFILGTGGHATSCIDLVESTKKYKVLGVISKNRNDVGKKFLNKYKVVGIDKDYKKILKVCKNIVIGISFYKDLKYREKIFNELKNFGFNVPTICSSKSYISPGSIVGEGSQIFHGVIINKNVNIGKNCIINSGSLVEHDVVIEQNSQISTGAIINGGCHIRRNSFVGSGSILRENINLKMNSFLKMGSLIKK